MVGRKWKTSIKLESKQVLCDGMHRAHLLSLAALGDITNDDDLVAGSIHELTKAHGHLGLICLQCAPAQETNQSLWCARQPSGFLLVLHNDTTEKHFAAKFRG